MSLRTATSSFIQMPGEAIDRDWVYAYWMADEPARVYLPLSDEGFDQRLTDGLRFNKNNVYLQYRYDEDGNRETEIGNWEWLSSGNMIQVSFENDKEALNYRILSVSADRLELEVIPD
ncbi:MAG: hypothetical protein WBB45_09780 [Cyclobacteriaceae bacterium]